MEQSYMLTVIMIFKYLLFFPIITIGQLLAFPLVPIAVYFADEETGRLPWIFRWLETQDCLGWKAANETIPVQQTTAKWGRRAGMLHYLLRNKAYTLAWYLGHRADREDSVIKTWGPLIPPKWGVSMWVCTLTDTSGKYFELQPRISLGKFYIYLRIGWKLMNYVTAKDGEWPIEQSGAGMFNGISPRINNWD